MQRLRHKAMLEGTPAAVCMVSLENLQVLQANSAAQSFHDQLRQQIELGSLDGDNILDSMFALAPDKLDELLQEIADTAGPGTWKGKPVHGHCR